MSETKETPSPQKEVQETPPPQKEVKETPPSQKEVKETPPPQKEVKETPPPQKEVKETPPSREAGEETTSSKKAGEASTSSQKAGEETTSSQKAGEKAATSSKKAGEETISPQKAGEVMAPSPQKAGEETAASPQKAGEEATLSQKEDGSNEKQDPEKAKIAGILKKWTNYFSRWQDRYVSCEEGWIFYFRSEKEVGDHCRGAMNLAKAIIRPHKSKTRRVDVKVNKRTWRFRASSETESQKWTDVLNLSGIHFRSKTNQNYPNILKLFPGYVEEKSKDKEKLF